MPLYSIQAPNGQTYQIKGPEGASQDQVINEVLRQHPDAEKVPSSGMMSALSSGFRQGAGSAAQGLGEFAGLGGLADYGKRMQESAATSYRPTSQEDIEAAKARGLLPEAGAYLSKYLTEPVGEMAGSMAGRYGLPALAAYAVPEAALGGAAATAAFAGVNLPMYAGEEIAAQKKRGEDPSYAKAIISGIAHTAIDAVAGHVLAKPLSGLIGKTAQEQAKDLAPEVLAGKMTAEQASAKVGGALRNFLQGTAQNAVVGPGMMLGHDIISRISAGEDLTSEDALNQYGQSLKSGLAAAPLFGAYSGYLEGKGAAGTLEKARQDRVAIQQEEAKKTQQQEEAAKNSPEYALDIEQKYAEAEKQKADLLAQRRTIEKGSPTESADKEYNRIISQKLQEHYKETLAPLAREKARLESQGVMQTAKESARTAQMSPEDYMLEQLTKDQEGIQARGRPAQGLGTVEEPEPAVDTTVHDYANGQVEAAKSVGYTDLGDYADYIMEKPELAAQYVQTRPTLPGLTKSENSSLLSGVKLRLQDREKQARNASKNELENRQADLKMQQVSALNDPLEMLKASQEQVEEHNRTAESNFDYLDPVFEKATNGEPVVAVNPDIKPDGRRVVVDGKPVSQVDLKRNRIDSLLTDVQEADREAVAARQNKQPDAVINARQRRAKALSELDMLSSEEGNPYAKEFISARRSQEQALGVMEDMLHRVKSNNALGKDVPINEETGEPEYGKGTAASTQKSLLNKADQARAQYITSVLQEAALHRRAKGLAPLSTDEALKSASQLHDTLSEWMERVHAAPIRLTKIVTKPAVYKGRAEKRVMVAPEEFEMRDLRPTEERRFGAYDKAIQVIKEQLDGLREDISNPESKPKREEQLLKRQFATTEAQKVAEARGETATTLGGELRRRTEYVRDKMTKMGPMRPAARGVLNKAADLMDEGKASRQLLDATEELVDRINSGRQVTQADVRAVNDALAAGKSTAMEQKAAGQMSLFPEKEADLGYIRATPANFAKAPKLVAARAAVDEARRVVRKAELSKNAKTQVQTERVEELNKLQATIENIKSDTKFSQAGTSLWSPKDIARAYVGQAEFGKTPEEKKIVSKYLKGETLTPDETFELNRTLADFNADRITVKANTEAAQRLVAEGKRLEDANNKLLKFMQDSNESVRKAARERQQELALPLATIRRIKSNMVAKKTMTPQEKAVHEVEGALGDAKAYYQNVIVSTMERVEKDIEQARADLLNPQIAKASEALKTAQDSLAKESAELEKINKRLEGTLTQKEGKNRTQLATYQLFKYEEKKGILEDLQKNVKEQQDALNKMLDERYSEIESAHIVGQAMLDGNVKIERDFIISLEKKLAKAKGENVADNPNEYPYSNQRIVSREERARLKRIQEKTKELNLEPIKFKNPKTGELEEINPASLPSGTEKLRQYIIAAENRLENAERKSEVFKEKAESLEIKLQRGLGLPGVRHEQGKRGTETLLSAEELEAEKRREESLKATKQMSEAERAAEIRRLHEESMHDQLFKLSQEAASYKGPEDLDKLADLAASDNITKQDRAEYLSKINALNKMKLIEEQMQAIKEGKPRRKGPAEVETTAAQSAKKPFRSASEDAIAARRLKEQGEVERKADALLAKERAKRDASYEDYDRFYSRGEATAPHTKESLEAELNKAMGERVTGRPEEKITHKLQVFDSVDDYIKQSRQPLLNGKGGPKIKILEDEAIPKDAKGFVDPEGRAVLFANNINKGQGLSVLLHEVGAHLGFRNFFNEGQYKALAQTVKSWEKRNDDSIEARVAKAARARVEAAKTKASQVDDEMIAYTVEEAIKAGVDPTGTKKGGALQNWLNMIVNSFKNVLKKFGLNPKELNAQDLVDLAYGAAQLELKGTWHGTAADFGEFDFDYMGKGEGAQAFGWGSYRAQSKGIAKTYEETALNKALGRINKDPKMIEWVEKTEPTFNGAKAEDLRDWAMTHGGKYDLSRTLADGTTEKVKNPGIPEDYLSAVQEVLSNAKKALVDGNTKPGQEETKKENLYSELRSLAEQQRNKDLLKYNNVVAGSTDVFSNVERPTEKEFHKFLDEFENWVNKQEKNNSGFQQPKITQAPLSLPAGAMYRTLHTRPEEHYLDLDAHPNDQNSYIKDKLRSLFEQFSPEYKRVFNKHLSEIPENRQKGKHIVHAIEDALKQNGFEERLAPEFASRIMHAEGIAGSKYWDNSSRFEKNGFKNYVDFGDKEEGAAILGKNLNPIGPAQERLYSKGAEFDEDNALTRLSGKVIAQPKSFKEKYFNNAALATEMNLVDMRAPLREALKQGAEGINKPQVYQQAMYHVVKADQKLSLAMTTLSKGPLEIYKDEKGLYGVRSTNQNNAKDVFDAMSKIPGANAQGKVDLATTYMVAQRALNKGANRLDSGALGVKEEDLKAALADVESKPELKAALEDVRNKYNAYNKGLIEFNVQAGAISKEVAAKLLQDKDYVPFYRVDNNGNASLVFNDNVQINIGDIRRQPYLHALKGGETKILPLNESLMQNTMLLTDKAMTTMAQKSVAYALQEIGSARGKDNDMLIKRGSGPAGPDIIHFNVAPDPARPDDDGKRWIKVDTKNTLMEGVSPELVVKSLEGTNLTLPAFLKLGGAASDMLRSGVTRTPLYVAHQLLRDPMAATFTGGVRGNPLTAVYNASKHFLSMQMNTSKTGEALIEKGLIQSNIFKGDSSDVSKFAKQLASGKDVGAIQKLVNFADKMAMDADAATRALVYENALKSGLSEVEADMMTMESINFHKQGLSSSVQYANRLVPFMNSQTQALNVFAKAARGNMPFNEQLNIKKKFFNNALMLSGLGIAYGMALSDNDYFKNAKPADRYGNMFVFLPGIDEPFKIPVPYEVGYFFSMGVAAADGMRNEVTGEEQVKALKGMFLNSVPGYSSKFVPQLLKPIAEVATNKDFYTGAPLESARLQQLDPAQRFTANTTEIAKYLGTVLPGVSPIQIEHLVRGYFGQLPLMAAASTNDMFRQGNEKPAARITEMPLIGSAFQKKYGGGDESEAYSEAQDAIKAQNTFNAMAKEGRTDEARQFMKDNKDRLILAKSANQFQTTMAKLAANERMIQNMPNLNDQQKRQRLDQIDQIRQRFSANFRKMAERV